LEVRGGAYGPVSIQCNIKSGSGAGHRPLGGQSGILRGLAGLGAQSALVVSNYAVRWQGDTCRIGRMYKTGETIYIQALCWGEAGEKSIPVSLHPRGNRLSVTWDHGTRGDLQRCP
jgi:hypothetical protein